MYIHELNAWPKFVFSYELLARPLASVRYQQGRLTGRVERLPGNLREQAVSRTISADVLATCKLDGQTLAPDHVNAIVAGRLAIGAAEPGPGEHAADGVLKMIFDASEHFAQPLSPERLFGWHAALVAAGGISSLRAKTHGWRDSSADEINAVLSAIGTDRAHFQAPAAHRLDDEVQAFLNWFERGPAIDLVLKAGIAHFWFLTIQPFADGSGSIARAIADMALLRSEGNSQRFYSMSAQIENEHETYFDMLARTQRGTLDITPWLDWFLECLGRAIERAQTTLASVLRQAQFWQSAATLPINDRQRLVLNYLLDHCQPRVNSSTWAALADCSQDTAHRDIVYLVAQGLLKKDSQGGRSTAYRLLSEI